MTFVTGDNARWEVIWWNAKYKRYSTVTFGTDLSSAIELYMKVKSAGKKMPTLRCGNVGFPPPEKYRPYTKRMIRKERVNGRVRKKVVEVEVTPMSEMNLKGIWWCPYCMKMRRFEHQDGAMYEGYYVDGEGMYCPVCQINHRDNHVRKHNPQAQTLAYKMGQKRRRASGARTRRTRRSPRRR